MVRVGQRNILAEAGSGSTSRSFIIFINLMSQLCRASVKGRLMTGW